MRAKMVKVIDVEGNVYQYNAVNVACEKCLLPVWYGIYPNRVVPRRFEELFKRIISVTVDDVVRYSCIQ